MKYLAFVVAIISAPVIAMYAIDGKVVQERDIQRICQEGGGCIWVTRAKLEEIACKKV